MIELLTRRRRYKVISTAAKLLGQRLLVDWLATYWPVDVARNTTSEFLFVVGLVC